MVAADEPTAPHVLVVLPLPPNIDSAKSAVQAGVSSIPRATPLAHLGTGHFLDDPLSPLGRA